MKDLAARVITLISCTLVACSDPVTPAGSSDPAVTAGVLVGAFEGVFPCANCLGIEATLWLRSDGAFFLRQRYLEADRAPQEAVFSLGRWRWELESQRLVLAGPGPQRRFAVIDRDSLSLQTASGLEHRLSRREASTIFSDRLRLEGEYSLTDRLALFRECHTGLSFPVADEGEYARVQRQYRSVAPQGQPALVVIDGRLRRADTADGATERLVVDQLISVKPGVRCAP